MKPAPWGIREAREALQVMRRRAGLDLDGRMGAPRSSAPTSIVSLARGNHDHAARFRALTGPVGRARTTQRLAVHRTLLRGEHLNTPAGQRTVTRTR